MRRLGIAAAIVLLLVLGGYTALWFHIAGRIEDGIDQWAETTRAQNIDVSWRGIRIGGYPLAFRIELSEARLRDTAHSFGGEIAAPRLSGSAYPWSFRTWRLSAPDGLSATAGAANAPLVKLTARSAAGDVGIAGERGTNIRVDLAEPTFEAGVRATAREAVLRVTLPEHPPQTHTEKLGTAALQLHDLNLPAVPAPFRNPLDEIALGVTVLGPIPSGPPREAAQAWRNAGGTVELDPLAIRWGSLEIAASGTLALDPELQPEGAFSGSIEGADELLTAFVDSGRVRAGDAALARMALSVLAKPGPNGRPRITTSFTMQNGEMRLGPVKLGRAPRVVWP